jgi:hypothetical protein
MEQGEFQYMEAYYSHVDGDDLFAAGVKVSVSTVNRRDSQFGIDETQMIKISSI